MSDLKPCLCGSDKVHFGYEPFCGLTFWRVMCDTCGTQTSTFDTKEEAAKVWNTRPAEDAKDREIERLKTALKQIAEIANRRGPLTVATWQKDAWYELAKIAKEALAKAPDTNVGKMEEK